MDFIVIEAGGSPLNLKQSSISLQCQMSNLNMWLYQEPSGPKPTTHIYQFLICAWMLI